MVVKNYLLFVNEDIYGGKVLCVDEVELLLFIGGKDIFGGAVDVLFIGELEVGLLFDVKE